MEKVLLIVEDSKEVIEVIQENLDGLFDKIVVATSVDEALQKLAQFTFSFISLDINLEGRNGAEIVKFLVQNPENPNNGCPVVIVSGIINQEFVEKYGGRFAGVVMKPFDQHNFVGLVKDIMENGVAEKLDDIPDVKCELPFPIPQLEQKVAKVLEQVKKNTRLKQLFASMNIDRSIDNFITTHIGMLINISTAICGKLEWNTDKTLEKFVYAAYLHDMALSDRPDLARFNGGAFDLELLKDKLSAQDYKLIFEHATIAAKVIDELEEIPPDVGMIVRQHHENPKEAGFPARLGYGKITPLATVFIVAHDLTHYILDNPKWELSDFIAKGKTKYKGPHFSKVLSALNEMD